MLSFIFPGGGQYYAGAEAKGLALTLLGIGAPIIGYANVNRDNGPYGYGCGIYNGPSNVYGGGPCRGHYDYTPAAIGLGVGITAWLYGVATAGTRRATLEPGTRRPVRDGARQSGLRGCSSMNR